MAEIFEFSDRGELLSQIEDGLRQFNARTNPDMATDDFGFAAKIAQDELIGGVWVRARMGAAEIDTLWVADGNKDKGLGSKLLRKAEAEAIVRGASLIHLNTFDFQAPRFYQKHGYEIFGEICFPNGTTKFWMKKQVGKT